VSYLINIDSLIKVGEKIAGGSLDLPVQ